jgi:hypothetical protein
MLKRLITVILIILFCFSTGCTYWYQQGRTFNECEEDLQQCLSELNKYADMSDIGNYEVNFIKNCMTRKGYTLFLEDSLPVTVKRRDPAMNTFWLLAGVSGTLEEYP